MKFSHFLLTTVSLLCFAASLPCGAADRDAEKGASPPSRSPVPVAQAETNEEEGNDDRGDDVAPAPRGVERKEEGGAAEGGGASVKDEGEGAAAAFVGAVEETSDAWAYDMAKDKGYKPFADFVEKTCFLESLTLKNVDPLLTQEALLLLNSQTEIKEKLCGLRRLALESWRKSEKPNNPLLLIRELLNFFSKSRLSHFLVKGLPRTDPALLPEAFKSGLRELTLVNSGLGPSVLPPLLAALPSAQIIDLSGNNFPKVALPSLKRQYPFTLILNNCNIEEASFKDVENLGRLELNENPLKELEIENPLFEKSPIKLGLGLGNTALSLEALKELLRNQGRHLRSLGLENNNLGEADAKSPVWGALSEIEKLDLSGNRLAPGDVKTMLSSFFRSPVVLNVSGNTGAGWTEAAVEEIKALKLRRKIEVVESPPSPDLGYGKPIWERPHILVIPKAMLDKK